MNMNDAKELIAENERTGGSAFPTPDCSEWDGDSQTPGMTLRDWFAGQAPSLPTFIEHAIVKHLETEAPECPPWNEFWLKFFAKQEARWRMALADAMLEARKR